MTYVFKIYIYIYIKLKKPNTLHLSTILKFY